MRIVHVLHAMNAGGVETWLMDVLRRIDTARFETVFLVHTEQPALYDDEIRSLGATIVSCLHPSRPLSYRRAFLRIMSELEPDVVHSHVHHFSGYVLRLARTADVRVRIAHSHSDTAEKQAASSLTRRLYYGAARRSIQKHATHKLACSEVAGRALFGERNRKRSEYSVLHYGVPLDAFDPLTVRPDLRASLGVPSNTFVIGHVGRFAHPKNHVFLLGLCARIERRIDNVHFLLVGGGEGVQSFRAQLKQRDLESRFTLAGVRQDIPQLMIGAMDVFALPSLYEGLPLVLVEAQAAGLSCVVADTVTPEVDVIPELIVRRPLVDSFDEWEEAIVRLCRKPRLPVDHAVKRIEGTSFDITESVRRLESLYDQAGSMAARQQRS